MIAKAVIQRAERRLPFSVVVPSGNGPAISGVPVMDLRRPESFYARLGASGLIGFGEAYQAGDWDSDDLAALLPVFAAGVDAFVPPGLQWIRGHSAAARRPRAEEQTIEGARGNARHHYSLPDELFRAFLDETMCYSSAIFPTDADGRVLASDSELAEAQHRKIDRLLDLAGVGTGPACWRSAQAGASSRYRRAAAEHSCTP